MYMKLCLTFFLLISSYQLDSQPRQTDLEGHMEFLPPQQCEGISLKEKK